MYKTAAVVLLAGIAAGASADTFFSFASDGADTTWTFQGAGNSFTASIAASDPLSLLVNGDGAGPAVSVDAVMSGGVTIRYVTSVAMPSGSDLHIYTANGSFQFSDPVSGNLLLDLNVGNATFSSLGNAAGWGSSATLESNDTFANLVTYTATADLVAAVPNAANFGLAVGSTIGDDDFAFTLTAINTDGSLPYTGADRGVAVGADFLPIEDWFSEGSFSGSAGVFVPTPGGAALLGLGGLAMIRRRR